MFITGVKVKTLIIIMAENVSLTKSFWKLLCINYFIPLEHGRLSLSQSIHLVLHPLVYNILAYKWAAGVG